MEKEYFVENRLDRNNISQFTKIQNSLYGDVLLESPCECLVQRLYSFDKNFKGYCWPNIETLSNCMRREPRSIIRYLKKLSELGYIKIFKRMNSSNIYYFTFPNIPNIYEFLKRFDIYSHNLTLADFDWIPKTLEESNQYKTLFGCLDDFKSSHDDGQIVELTKDINGYAYKKIHLARSEKIYELFLKKSSQTV